MSVLSVGKGIVTYIIEEGFIKTKRQRTLLLVRGQNLFNALPHYSCFDYMTIRRIG